MRNQIEREGSGRLSMDADIAWVEQPRGVFGSVQLRRLAVRLRALPASTRSVRIDWGRVSHIDFRSFSEVAEELRRLHRRGVKVQCLGFDSYLMAIVLFSFSIEEVELFAGGSVPLPAREGEIGVEELILNLSPLGVSKN